MGTIARAGHDRHMLAHTATAMETAAKVDVTVLLHPVMRDLVVQDVFRFTTGKVTVTGSR